MGKSKTNKFKRPPFSVGLPVNAEKEADVEECDSDGPAAEYLEKVRKQPRVLWKIHLNHKLTQNYIEYKWA